MDIIFSIADENKAKIVDTMKWLWPVPKIPNPAYVNKVATPEEPKEINEFTDNQWAKEGLRRWIIKQVKRRDDYLAKKTINNLTDDNLIS